jgi:hypothetical protein
MIIKNVSYRYLTQIVSIIVEEILHF